MPLREISRIEFCPYKKGEPFAMAVTFRSGENPICYPSTRQFVMLRGDTEAGAVTIKRPNPISVPTTFNTRKLNRKHDLPIQYLEFPASSGPVSASRNAIKHFQTVPCDPSRLRVCASLEANTPNLFILE